MSRHNRFRFEVARPAIRIESGDATHGHVEPSLTPAHFDLEMSRLRLAAVDPEIYKLVLEALEPLDVEDRSELLHLGVDGRPPGSWSGRGLYVNFDDCVVVSANGKIVPGGFDIVCGCLVRLARNVPARGAGGVDRDKLASAGPASRVPRHAVQGAASKMWVSRSTPSGG